mgnify:FL=1
MAIKTGDTVIAVYGRHNGQREYTGVVLARNDIRAWTGAVAFDYAEPTQAAVDAHVAWCERMGCLGRVPVAWEFGKVYWEEPDRLVLAR